MQDRRQHKRYAVDARYVKGKMLPACAMEFLDISLGGISVAAGKRFEISREYSLKLEYHDKRIPVNGVVIWSLLSKLREGVPGKMIPLYEAGIQFNGCSDDTVRELAQLMKKHGLEKVNNPDSPILNTRISIDTSNRAMPDSPEGFRIKKVSIAGLLIQSGCEMELEERMPLEIVLPDDKPIVFVGRVDFCIMRMGEDKGHYDIWIEFVHISKEDRDRLENFIRLLHSMPQHAVDISIKKRTANLRTA